MFLLKKHFRGCHWWSGGDYLTPYPYIYICTDETGKMKNATLLVLQTLEDAVGFTDAVLRLVTTDTIAPLYYIVGGVYPGQGAIITRDRLATLDTWYLDPKHGRLVSSLHGINLSKYVRVNLVLERHAR